MSFAQARPTFGAVCAERHAFAWIMFSIKNDKLLPRLVYHSASFLAD